MMIQLPAGEAVIVFLTMLALTAQRKISLTHAVDSICPFAG
jgi:hypothetical protein